MGTRTDKKIVGFSQEKTSKRGGREEMRKNNKLKSVEFEGLKD
jgi:hypothetical protein